MSKSEGVIKFRLDFAEAAALTAVQLAEINAWRKVLVIMGMIGQTPERYDNYGFGNISRRLTAADLPGYDHPFVISGTQTGGVADLLPEHYATVLWCRPAENHVSAQGPMRPSSESMTHGVVYESDSRINWVFHAHDPYIWQQRVALGLPTTADDVPYGSPEMSAEVGRLFRETDVAQRGIFAMGGHVDGIVTFGATAEEAGSVLLSQLASAIRLGY
ncbi:MAG: class II aldolase/adducin family protein [Chloroflexota bacterium]